jgi:hypothetical protein
MEIWKDIEGYEGRYKISNLQEQAPNILYSVKSATFQHSQRFK